MDNVYLKQLADTKLKGAIPSDINAPLSFLEWRAQSPSIPEADDSYHYNQYILAWFAKNKDKAVSSKFVLRQKYLFLLEQLQVFFTEEEKNTWYNQVNFADEKELLTAIPFFARKLRDIAIYYLGLRKQLKNTKLKYNTVGTSKAVEHEIYSYILNALSPDSLEHSPQFLTLMPMFSSLQQSLVVTVDELYDDNQYFDRSPTAPLSGYVNILDAATAAFFQTKGLALSSDSWLFETFNLPVTGDLNTLVNRLTGNVFETSDVNLYGNFIQSFLGENKYTLTYTAPPSSYTVTNIPLSAGNNRFYYPYGLVDNTLTISGQVPPIALSSVQLSGAASGTTLEQSDSVFIKYGNTIKGAWYRYIDYDESDEKMDAYLAHNATTSFIYPYPGYGLSAVDIPWTGASLVYDPEYPFLSKSLKASVQQQYWADPLSSDACYDIFLNNTTAVSSGSNADEDFNKADKIYLRDRNMVYDTKLPVRELSGAWLYKFTQTALPISPIQPNVILWPYNIVDTTLADLPEHLQNQGVQDVCNPVIIQDLDTSYFTAASSIDLADRIYKLRYYNDNEQTDALECIWLSGGIDTVGLHSFPRQDGLTLSLSAGQTTRFVWTGADNTPLSSVFTSVNHQTDCPFTTKVPSVSAYEWQKCTCKQTYYSPLGHPGFYFNEYNSLADFIVEDTSTNFSNFDLGTWTDLSGNDVLNSPSFAWYNTFEDNSWGYGRWTSKTVVPLSGYVQIDEEVAPVIPNPDTLKLKYGHSYFYGRSNSKLTSDTFPLYNVLNSFNTTNTKWIQAKPNNDKSSWISSEQDASLVISAGDYLKIGRQQQTTSYYLSSVAVTNSSSNEGSIWSTYDSIALSDNAIQTPTTLFWPNISTQLSGVSGLYYGQYPPITFDDLMSPNPIVGGSFISPTSGSPGILRWNIVNKDTKQTFSYYNTPVATFTPPTTGTFYVEVTGRSYVGGYYYLYGESSPNKGSTGSYLVSNAFSSSLTATSDTTFVVPSGVSTISISAVGAGGGGGSGNETADASGGGGGSGGLVVTTVSVNKDDILSIKVGKGGRGSNATNSLITVNGVAGESTIVTLISSNGIKRIIATAGGGKGGGGAFGPKTGAAATSYAEHPETHPGAGGAGGTGSTTNGNNGSSGVHEPPSNAAVPGGAGGASLYKGLGTGGTGAQYGGDVSPQYWNGIAGGNGGVEFSYTVPTIYGLVPLSGTVIPDISAIPQYHYQNTDIPIYAPTGGFLIEQPLKGWSYQYNGIQVSQYDGSAGAKPYWAEIYSDKDVNTHSKGVYTFGYPNDWVDGYLPHHIPRLSPLKLKYGNVLEYERVGSSFWWTQPLTFQTANGTSVWSVLDFGTNVSNLSSIFDSENFQELVTFPTTSASDIVLTNNIDGTPVQILYYALSSYTWSVSTVSIQDSLAPSPQLYFQSQLPYANLSNRFYPTIATVPTLEYLYSKNDVGGYFVPQNLGASQWINKDFTSIAPISSSLSAVYIVEDANIHIGGRGLSKEDQNTVYDWTENNLWMKESSTTGDLAGFVRKDLTKQLQTFIPYQSNSAETSVGLVTPQSRITPWGGPFQDEWTDLAKEPKGFTGVRNVQAWSDLQVLKQNGKVADNWVTDVYGNQYGLFKQLSGISLVDRKTTPGEIWVRTNDQVTQVGTTTLSSIFAVVDSSFYSELAGSVYEIDCFADVLMVHTPSVLLFAKINFDYETNQITTIFDNARGFFNTNSSIGYLDSNTKFEQTWFFPQQKQLIVLITELQGSSFIPRLYKLDIDTMDFSLIFPTAGEDLTNIANTLSQVSISPTQDLIGALTHNNTLQKYVVTYSGMDTSVNSQPVLINFEISNWDAPRLQSIDIYKDLTSQRKITPPLILDVDNTLVFTNSTPYRVYVGVAFSITLPVIGGTSYAITNDPTGQVSVNPTTGVFSGTITTTGIHQINFAVSNNIGTSYYSLTLVM